MQVAHRYRPMSMQDLDEVMRIEPRIYAFPWTRGNFKDSIESGHVAEVMESQQSIIGYALMMMVLDEAHLLNLSIDQPYQGKGLGRELLMHMVDMAKSKGAKNMFLEVRASNRIAIALYQHVGFCEMSIRKAYYRDVDGREDAILMGLAL